MATTYQLNISMSDTTVRALTDSGYYLYGFKGVNSGQQNGVPLVWFQTQAYSQLTQIQWEEQYAAYTSTNQIIPQGQITASAAYDIDLGQTLNVTGKSGIGNVAQGGTQGAISILNQTPPIQFTCGISQMQTISGGASTNTPLCAFPLFGTGLVVMEPVERCFLMFATKQVNTGTVVEQAFMQGILVDLTGAPQQTRTVNFDINSGWSWDGGAWGASVDANAELTPLLIKGSTSTSVSKKLAVSKKLVA